MATEPRGNLGRLRFGPSDQLVAMFRACAVDPTRAIKVRLKSLLHMFVQHHKHNGGDAETMELAVKCCCEAGIWYYRIVEQLGSGEKERLGVTDISFILENDLIQVCLVTCSLEIAISSNRLPCDFPQLLHILKVPPYHFWRVIELVLRAEAGVPRAAVRHLARAEYVVLESLAWTRDSPLWGDIRANGGRLPTCQQVMLPEQLGGPRLDGHPHQSGLSVHSDQQHPPQAGNRPHRSKPLPLFARKVYNLMALRLTELCSTLGISEELRLRIWTCLEFSLVHCTDLMVDRHLDQLLMCAIYIVPKVTSVEIPFKHIMKCYRSQAMTCKDVCKNVLISRRDSQNSLNGNTDDGEHSGGILTPNTPSTHYPEARQEERGNLIDFYNQVYTVQMQHFALQFAPTPEGQTPPLSPYPQLWRATPRRRRLSGSFVSPTTTETSSPCTPTRSPQGLRDTSNVIWTGRTPPSPSNLVALGTEEEEDGPSAKRIRLSGQSAWLRRLQSVVNERVTIRGQDQNQNQGQNQDQGQGQNRGQGQEQGQDQDQNRDLQRDQDQLQDQGQEQRLDQNQDQVQSQGLNQNQDQHQQGVVSHCSCF